MKKNFSVSNVEKNDTDVTNTMLESETEQIAMTVNDVSASIQAMAKNVRLVVNATRVASNETGIGKRVVYQMTDSIQSLAQEIATTAEVIQELKKDSDDIGSVVGVIRGIAEQTSLLALNAAIEAARTGDQGREFAMTANEVRILVSRTQESAVEMQAMIERLQSAARYVAGVMADSHEKAEGSVEKANKMATSLDVIMGSVNTIKDVTAQIATAVDEQSFAARQAYGYEVRFQY
ncbi:MAG: hypothetical protein GXP18_09030 [Gammaproteobacteria bacterium]|nr:hypothetical protein [Gammaproteobacteria bacterium]